MPKLPVCPHCHTIYRYGDVRKLVFKKEHTCYHCDKKFSVSRKNIFILFLIIALITAIFNLLELYVMTADFTALMITNVITLSVGVILIPFFVRFIVRE